MPHETDPYVGEGPDLGLLRTGTAEACPYSPLERIPMAMLCFLV
jgi:hypothetical protein